MNNKKFIYLAITVIICIFVVALISADKNINECTIQTSATATLNNKKIGWGIKRNDNNEQPDLGSQNKKLMDENQSIAMGNNEDKYIYLTFDEGYEAGYTEKILDVLKENNVKAAFFITGHYLNTKSELVRRMIDEGHIIRKSYCKPLQYARFRGQ